MKTWTKGEYVASRRHGCAGTVDSLQPETVHGFRAGNPEWHGRYWGMWFEPKSGTVLGPVNVDDD